jgi:hypothetical protein
LLRRLHFAFVARKCAEVGYSELEVATAVFFRFSYQTNADEGGGFHTLFEDPHSVLCNMRKLRDRLE